MFFYKKLYINDLTGIDLKRYPFLFKTNNPFEYINVPDVLEKIPEIMTATQKLSLDILKIAIIKTSPLDLDVEPHIDSQENSLALNLPIENCENSYTVFYNLNETSKILTLKKPNGVLYKKIISAKPLSEAERYTLDCPTIINTQAPHKVVYQGSGVRRCMSIRFKKDPWHLALP